MHGVKNPHKEQIVTELKNGIPSSVLSRKYGVAMSTITTWIKELPVDYPSKYNYRNRQISVMRKVNRVEAKIADMLDEYIVCGITDKEWDDLMGAIQKELISLATFTGLEDEEE